MASDDVEKDTASWIALGIIYVSLASYVLVSLRWCCHNLSLLRSLLGRLRKGSQAVCLESARRAWFSKKPLSWMKYEDMDLQSAAVAKLAEQRLMETCRFAIFAVSPFLVINLSLALKSKHSDWDIDYQIGETLLVDGHELTSAAVLVVATLCMLLKSQPGLALRIGFNLFVSARLMWKLFHHKTVFDLVFDRTDVMTLRFCLSFVTCQPRITAVLNIVYSALSCYVYAMWERTHADAHFGKSSATEFFVQEMNACIFILLIGFVSEMRFFSEARATIEARASREMHKSLWMLLNTVCDVVVELDVHLRLVEKCETLAAMLLQGADRSLKNMNFQDFFFEEADKDRVQQHLGQPRQGILKDMAIPIRVRMRDSAGSCLDVELLHAQYESLDGGVHYIVGLREVNDDDFNDDDSDTLGGDMSELSVGLRAFATRKAPPGSSRGTPGSVERRELSELQPHNNNRKDSYDSSNSNDDAGSLGNSDPGSAQKASLLLRPDLKETSIETRLLSLMSLLTSWNIQLSKRGRNCCSFHSVVHEAIGALQLFRKRSCIDIAGLCKDWQCPGCGILDENGNSAGYDEADGKCSFCP